MTIEPSFAAERAALPPFERTALSIAFEAFWRALPKDGLVPARAAFRPERAARFLKHLLLCEAAPGAHSAIRIRLVGSEYAMRLQRDITGHDYLQHLPKARHAAVKRIVGQVVAHPCGFWQIAPIHYERGYSHHIEYTTFPLLPPAGGAPLLLVLTQAVDGLVAPQWTVDRALSTETAVVYRFIDIGAGVPAGL